jgi:hypothetical protein
MRIVANLDAHVIQELTMSTATRSPIALVRHPWLWIDVGLLTAVAGVGLNQLASALEAGGTALAIGLFLVGVGTAIRLQASGEEDFTSNQGLRNPARVLLSVFQFGVIAVFSWMLLAAVLGIDPFGRVPPNHNVPLNFKIGPMVIAWLLVVPLTFLSLRTIWRAPISGSIESGLMLALVCGIVMMAGASLPVAADTLRFFLAVLAFAVAFGVALVTAPVGYRYLVLSILATLHFLGIISATLATPPTPWLATQVWHRFAHPYLEFMYLNNAYHFYSPDPGAATHFWLRVFYDTGEKYEVEGGVEFPRLEAVWVKIPEVDERGRPQYPVALEYQRMLSLNENIVMTELPPPFYLLDDKGQILPGAILKNRLINSTTGEHWSGAIIGVDSTETTPEAEVPMTPGVAPETQYQKPALASMMLMEAYVRYAARKKHPEHPEWPVIFVKAYKALHTIPPWQNFVNGADPNDPATFRPIFNGTFDPETGKLLSANEPLLNWALPPLRGRPDRPESPVFCWWRLHAQERRFIYLPDKKEYVRLTPDLRKMFPEAWTKNLYNYVQPDWISDWDPEHKVKFQVKGN